MYICNYVISCDGNLPDEMENTHIRMYMYYYIIHNAELIHIHLNVMYTGVCVVVVVIMPKMLFHQ